MQEEEYATVNAGTYIAIWLPIFILLFVILPQQESVRRTALKAARKRRGERIMTNELVKKYVGYECEISSNGLTTVKGKIVEINENWIEVETKKGKDVLNLDFIQNIKIRNN